MKATLVFTGNNGPQNAVSNNTAFIIRELESLDFLVDINQLNLNNPMDFSKKLGEFLNLYSLVIIIGGLGTNSNPNAKEILAKNLNLNLAPHQESMEKLRQIYSRKNQQPTNEDIRYITVPQGAYIFGDENYAIPGFSLNSGGRIIIVLPDNDDVHIDMYVKQVFPYLSSLKNLDVKKDIINIFGLSSAQAESILRVEVMAKEALVSVFSKSSGAKYVHITSVNNGRYPSEAGIVELRYRVKNKLGSMVSNENIEMLPANIIRLMKQYELTLSVAESITDGHLARTLRAIPGGAQVVETQVNTLINDIKQKEMNVPKDILKDFPEASEHMAMCMSAGILENGTADIAVAISGGMISDNRGGLNSTGFVSLATEQGVLVKKVDLIGLSMRENQILVILTIAAMEMLYVFLKGLPNSVHDLFELKTLRIKDLDKTLENIRKKEEHIKQGEMETVTRANEILLPFRNTLPQRMPPVIKNSGMSKEQTKPTLPPTNQKEPVNYNTITENKENANLNVGIEGRSSTFDGAEVMGQNTDTKDGALPMDDNNYNNPFNPNQPEENLPPWNGNKGHQQPNQGQQFNPQQGQWGQQPNQGQQFNPQQGQWGEQPSQGQQFNPQQQDQWGQQPSQGQQFNPQQQNQWGEQPSQGQQFNPQQQNQWGEQPSQGQQFNPQQDQWGQQQPSQGQQFNPQQDQWGQQFNPQQQNQWGQQPSQGQQFNPQQQNQWGQQPSQGQQFNPQQQNQWGQQPGQEPLRNQPVNNQKNQKKKDNVIFNDEEELSFFQEARMILLPHKNNSLGKNIFKIVMIIAFLAFAIFLGYFISLLTGANYKENMILPAINPLSLYGEELDESEIPDTYPDNFSKDFAKLFIENPDIKGIIELEGGKEKYPVVQSESNAFYKTKDFYQNSGSTSFIDSRSDMFNKTTNTLVYGYSTKEQPLLKEVAKYTDLEYYKENPTVKFINVYESSDYAVFASFVASENPEHNDTYSYANYVNAINEEDFLDIIYDAKARSTIVTEVDVLYGDEIIFLSTDIDDFDGARVIVAAKKIETNEKINATGATINPTPLYPEVWYDIHGGEKPNIEPRPSELLPISIENTPWQLSEIEEPSSETPSSSSKIESSLPSSSKAQSVSSSKVESSKTESSKPESSKPEETSKEELPSSESSKVDQPPSSSSSQDENIPPPTSGGSTISVTYNGNVMTGNSVDIVSRVVAAEMSGFYPTEALKAQAIATYTFIIYNNNKGISPDVPMREPSNNIINAVASVDGQLVTFNGSVAFTSYYAISAGRTNASQEVWTESRPYLISVDSSACTLSPYYKQTKTISESEVRSLIETKLALSPVGDPSTWFLVTSKTQGGYNANMSIDGNSTTGSGRNINGFYLRTVFGLRSAAFDVSYSSGEFTFTTYGYGHGVGMSQVGSYHLVNSSGYDYRQVLAHYYPGTNVG